MSFGHKAPLSVIVCSDGRAGSLTKLHAALAHQHYAPFEIVYVIGPTEDGAWEAAQGWARAPGVKQARCGERNLSLARNVGAALAAGEILAFIDDDALPEPEWLAQIAAAFDDEAVGAASGAVFDPGGFDFQFRFSLADRFGASHHEIEAPFEEGAFPYSALFPHAMGANCAVRRDALTELGGFDEEYEYYLDETDLCCRLIDAGWLIRQRGDAPVHHKFLENQLRDAKRVLLKRYPVLKNQLYFALINDRGHHEREEILAGSRAFFARHRTDMEVHVARGEAPTDALAQFDHDAERAWAIGLARGDSGARRLRPPGAFGSPPPFVPFDPAQTAKREPIALIAEDGNADTALARARQLRAEDHDVYLILAGAPFDDVSLEEGIWLRRRIARFAPPPADSPDAPEGFWPLAAAVAADIRLMRQFRHFTRIEDWSGEGLSYAALCEGAGPLHIRFKAAPFAAGDAIERRIALRAAIFTISAEETLSVRMRLGADAPAPTEIYIPTVAQSVDFPLASRRQGVMSALQFSIVVPTYNGGPLLQACLQSIAGLDFDPSAYEVIVVDNNSTDDTIAIIDSFGFKRLSETRWQSSYAARNTGIEAARGAIIAFTDSDCEVAPDWLAQLQRAADDNPGAGCIAGEILPFPASTPVERYSEKVGLLRQRGPLSGWHFKPYAQTANAAYRSDIFARIGRFDPTMKSGGDALIAWRMLDQTDYTIMFAPDAKVFHHHRTDVAGLWAQFSRYGGGKLSWAQERADFAAPDPDAQEAELSRLIETHAQAVIEAGLDEEKFLFPLYDIAAKSAHHTGYLRDMLARLNPGLAAKDWPARAASARESALQPAQAPTPAPKRARCSICGGVSFVPGPGGRLARSAPPQCGQCGSLERHRVLHDLLRFFRTIGSAKAQCFTVGERPRSKNPGFAGFKHFDAIGALESERAHLIVGCELFSRAESIPPETAISTLCDHLHVDGLLLIMQASGPLGPRTMRRDNGSWNVGSDFAWLASRGVPDLSVLGARALDTATDATVAFCAISQNSDLLRDLAAHVERSAGSAMYIAL